MDSTTRTGTGRRSAPKGLLKLAVAACAGALMAGPALAGNYNEATNGDFANSGASPTSVAVALGSNIITGVTGGNAAHQPDRDYFTLTIAPGQELISIDVLAGTDSPTRSFFGVGAGSQTLVNPAAGSAVGLLGWTLFSVADVGSNVLDDLGSASAPNFPAFPGATGFKGPLGAGAYTFWIQDSDPEIANYVLDFKVGIPEPASWALMLVGFGALGAALRRARTGVRRSLAPCST